MQLIIQRVVQCNFCKVWESECCKKESSAASKLHLYGWHSHFESTFECCAVRTVHLRLEGTGCSLEYQLQSIQKNDKQISTMLLSIDEKEVFEANKRSEIQDTLNDKTITAVVNQRGSWWKYQTSHGEPGQRHNMRGQNGLHCDAWQYFTVKPMEMACKHNAGRRVNTSFYPAIHLLPQCQRRTEGGEGGERGDEGGEREEKLLNNTSHLSLGRREKTNSPENDTSIIQMTGANRRET